VNCIEMFVASKNYATVRRTLVAEVFSAKFKRKA